MRALTTARPTASRAGAVTPITGRAATAPGLPYRHTIISTGTDRSDRWVTSGCLWTSPDPVNARGWHWCGSGRYVCSRPRPPQGREGDPAFPAGHPREAGREGCQCNGGRSDLRARPKGFTAPPYRPGVRLRPGGRIRARPRRRAGQDLQGRGYVLRAVGICAPGGPESEQDGEDAPPRGDPALPRRQRNDSPGEGQGIGIVARNRSAALQTPEGRSMKTSRLGLAAGPSHSLSRTHARQVTIPQPNKQ